MITMQIYGKILPVQYQTLQDMEPYLAGSLVSMSTLTLASSSLNVWHNSQQVTFRAC